MTGNPCRRGGFRVSGRSRGSSPNQPAVAVAVATDEFVGRFEEHGWKLAGTIVPIAYTVWSLWLVSTGIVLLV